MSPTIGMIWFFSQAYSNHSVFLTLSGTYLESEGDMLGRVVMRLKVLFHLICIRIIAHQ
ncbi:hypothetical protein ACPV3A_29415 [Paenibacillus sp. Dod16]|uniref:hypothetical protein n=1 Tax=Paenibacillus sp. Dod16 TaxID=3416392 RepID=UPI003CF694F1